MSRSIAIISIIILCLATRTGAQNLRMQQLEHRVYELNNAFRYDSSMRMLRRFLRDSAQDGGDRFYTNLFLAFTYRRLFDYPSTLKYLRLAAQAGAGSSEPEKFFQASLMQESMVRFEMQQYAAADSLMQVLNAREPDLLDSTARMEIRIQEGYLALRRKSYAEAEAILQTALAIASRVAPCKRPQVYNKLVELYAATGKRQQMTAAFKEAYRIAKECGLVRTQLHTLDGMAHASERIGDYRNALKYVEEHRRVANVYNNKEHLEQITELDKRYQLKEQEARLLAQDRQLQRSRFFLVLSIGVSLVALLLLSIGFFFRRQRREKRERGQQLQFTRQLLQHTEQDRRRIAANLHDGLGHELLGLKSILGAHHGEAAQRIDGIINEVRSISRHLHPVMLDKIGLKLSIEHLCERLMERETLFVSIDIDYSRQLPPDQELQLFRIVQEALTNSEKYAGAEAARVEIRPSTSGLYVSIRDNGRGFAVEETLAGHGAFGLHSIIERGSVLGAQVRISSAPQGTHIQFEIPLAP